MTSIYMIAMLMIKPDMEYAIIQTHDMCLGQICSEILTEVECEINT